MSPATGSPSFGPGWPLPAPWPSRTATEGSRDRYRRTARRSIRDDDLHGGRSAGHRRRARCRVCDRQPGKPAGDPPPSELSVLRIAERVTVADYPNVGAGFWSVLDIYCQPAVVASAAGLLIQAFGHAVPSIATNVKGLRDLIEPGENGVLVPLAIPMRWPAP